MNLTDRCCECKSFSLSFFLSHDPEAALDHRATDDIAPNLFEPSGTERLLVWATRKYAFRCATALLVDLEFRRVCGERLGLAVSTAFQEFLRLLAGYGRRPLALGPPGW